MSDFLFEYGLFSAKVTTFFLVILGTLMGVMVLLSSRQQERESIEIENLNDKFETMRDALEVEILSKDELKVLKKERKKEAKAKEKAEKKRFKEGLSDTIRPRLFVLKFTGDLNASDVNGLREIITAVLEVAKTEDEILVVLDSPGGIVHNYGLAASQLQRIRSRKIPLVVCIDLIAASGGYLMASVANKILAAPFAIVGSIGVLAQIPNFHRFLKKHDIDVEQLTAGEYKTTLTMFGENTTKAREKFREELEDVHKLFKQFVLNHRPYLDINKLATGEYWYGTKAIELKLVDELITSDDYLLQRSKEADIFQVSYIINQSLSDKISTFINDISTRLIRLAFRRTGPEI